MIRRIELLSIFIFLLFSSGCHSQLANVVQANEVELNVNIRPFYTSSEYVTYFNTNDISDIGNTVRINIDWHIKDIKPFDQLLYAPYIVVIPSEKGWFYAGSHRNIPPLTGNRTSIRKEIIERVLHNDPSYDWQNINTIGLHTRSKSFNQGFVTFSFKKSNLSAKDSPLFKIYLIYYDPVSNTGWYKVINQNANLVGLPTNT